MELAKIEGESTAEESNQVDYVEPQFGCAGHETPYNKYQPKEPHSQQ